MMMIFCCFIQFDILLYGWHSCTPHVTVVMTAHYRADSCKTEPINPNIIPSLNNTLIQPLISDHIVPHLLHIIQDGFKSAL